MPLLFKSVCALLQALEDNAANTKTALNGWLDRRNQVTIESWIKSHHVTITSSDVDVVAVLSAIFPEARTDRVYGLQPPSLSRILGRCLRIGLDRIEHLNRWKYPEQGDLGVCVERVVRQTEHQDVPNPVSLDQVDATLHRIAARSRFSAPSVRQTTGDDGMETQRLLETIYLRLSSVEAKWFTRMILKDYPTLDFQSHHVFNAIDRRLKGALNVRSTFEAAVGLLRDQPTAIESPDRPSTLLKPILGSKIGRVPYLKGRSVKNVVQLAAGRKMSVERKYDGEYCQIHINLNNEKNWIQIFSKSGKDSTVDRQRVHDAIRQSLQIGQRDCKFTRQCILEGEIVVYDDLEHTVAGFHKIRKHVSCSGSWSGTEMDSQAHKYEHLMIYYYDVMMIDDEVVMNERHATRRRRLEELVTRVRGRSDLSKQKVIDFSSSNGPEKLRTLLAHAFAQRWEGLVLKPSDEAYFSQRRSSQKLPAHCWIKLKKDYIPGLGDTVDFAVVGAGYNAARAAQLKCPDLTWTHFHIGCLRNKKEVESKGAIPSIKVVAALEVNSKLTEHLNQHGQYCALPFGSLASYHDPFVIDMEKEVSKDFNMSAVFRKPFVFDVVGAGFEKEPNRNYFTLRFSRVIKLHSDRDWKDSVGFDELQKLAETARTVPKDTKPCVTDWMQRLDQVDRGAKGSTVPWDLSDDDVETTQEGFSDRSTTYIARRSSRRPSFAPPLIRMDSQEMTDKEIRLDSGEVAERPPSQRSYLTNWSESNLPTPPRSSPVQQLHVAQERQPLSSMQSTNSTDRQRKRSIEDDYSQERTPKRSRVSPPAARIKDVAGMRISKQESARSKLPQSYKHPTLSPSRISSIDSARENKQDSPHKSFLVPKLSAGAAEALRFREKSRVIKDMEQTSPDRQTTVDEESSEESQSSQQSLIAEWQLKTAEPPSPRSYGIPDLHDSYIVLSPDISQYPYLTDDLLGSAGLASRQAKQVYGMHLQAMQPRPPTSYYDDLEKQDTVVLIEPRRHDPSLEMLKFLVGRVPEDSSQVLWVFDWRLVEDVFARGIDDKEKLVKKRLVGRFWYGEDGDGGLRWLSSKGLVQDIPREKIEESRRMSGTFLSG
ncbi:MAG: hypothetical protein Q9216_005410 [Gyalolechia sp. 2 TL-2023]